MLLKHHKIALAVALALQAVSANAAEEATANELEEVTVTGSRIQQSVGMTTPTPVAALTAAEIVAMAPGNLTEAMTQLPQFYGSATAENFSTGANGFFTSPGGGSLNLRGIGSKRTLTLLDGRRVVPASVYGGPDINMFPTEMLKRVEAVTGGASAQYGTDAVSGVINFILDTNFEGFQARAQVGRTDRNDAKSNEFGLSVGHALSDRLHILFSAEHADQDAVENFAGRDWYKGCSLVRSTAAGAGASLANPQLIPACNLHSTIASYDGIITGWTGAGSPAATANNRLVFGADGLVSVLTPGSSVFPVSNAQVGGGGDDTTGGNTANVSPSSSRNNAFVRTGFNLNDDTELYFQGMYGDQELRAVNAAGAFFNAGVFQPFTIYAGNPYLGSATQPGTAAYWMSRNNITSFTLGRLGSLDDFGNSHVANNTRSVSGTAGFKTKIAADGFFNDWTVDGYFQYGKTKLDAVQENGVRVDRIFLAADAVVDPVTGRTMCRVTQVSGLVPDCVPINLFGRGNASQAAIDWVTGFDPNTSVSVVPYLPGYPAETYSYVGDEDKHRRVSLTQRVFEVAASGQVAEGWAGPINMAFGAHYRKEAVDQKVQASQGNPAADPFLYPAWCNDGAPQQQCRDQIARGTRPAGNIGVRGVPNGIATNSIDFQFSKVPFIRGAFDVKEVFAETIVPLLAQQSVLDHLNLQASVRWADYAGSGSIWSYKAGLDAKLWESLRLRGTYSRDVRAANIGERFDRTGGFANITDRGVTPTPAAYGITIVSGGNPLLDPEKADTYTFGLVYTPQWLPGLDMSIDWLSVSLKDAIESLTPQEIADACYVRGDTDQCALITRDAGSNRITFINQIQQNLSKAQIKGIDAEIGYTHAVRLVGGNERLTVRAMASWLDENSRTNSRGVVTDLTGSVPDQLLKWKGTLMLNYSNGPFIWTAQGRYLGSGKLNATYNIANATTGAVTYNVADNRIGSTFYVDTRLSWDVPMGNGSVQLFANVNNLLDRDPPLVLGEFGGLFSTGSQYSTMYDVLGRRYTVGAKVSF